MKIPWTGMLVGFLALATPRAALASPFSDYCQDPARTVEEQATLRVLMSKVGAPSSLSEENCRTAEALTLQRVEVNFFRFPTEPLRSPLTDLRPLAFFANIEALSLAENAFDDLSPLQKLPRLRRLNLNKNLVAHAEDLAALRSLEDLTLSQTRMKDLTSLQHLSRLTDLNLSHNEVEDLTPLAGLASLRTLFLDGNHIVDLSPLKNLGRLETVQAAHNAITEFPLQAAAASFHMIDLEDNRLTSLAGFEAYSRLDALNLKRNGIADVAALSAIKSLRWLNLTDNRLTDIAALANSHDLEYLAMGGNAVCHIPDDVLRLTEAHLNSKGQWIRLAIVGADKQNACGQAPAEKP